MDEPLSGLVQRLEAQWLSRPASPSPSPPSPPPPSIQEQLERIVAKLEWGLGSLPPPLSEEAVSAFEVGHQVTLPEEYRAFLLRVGDIGEGPPHCGLLPPTDTPQAKDVPEWFEAGYQGLLNQPFPFTTYWLWEQDPEELDWDTVTSRLRYGNLCLGHDGCGEYFVLVVAGPERGQVWSLGDGCIQPLAPRCTFLSWYEYWLDGGDDWFRDFDYSSDDRSTAEAG